MPAAKASDQLAVPVAVRQFSVPSAKAVPFQYWLSETRLIETSTLSSPAPPVSEAVPLKSFHEALRYVALAAGKPSAADGSVVSIVQVNDAGEASVLPAPSVARTSNVRDPCVRPV